jgi:DMSO/TMAO reductase YedYZ molybdopterin-dependent catalytic subunit
MSFFDDPKLQGKAAPTPEEMEAGVIISPDTRRENRIPPGQSRTLKWPVLDASGTPVIDMTKWRLSIDGMVNSPIHLTWEEVQALPRTRVFSDFHCVTRWSRLGNLWEGVSTRHLIALAGGPRPEAAFVLAHGYDHGWTTNLPLERLMDEDALVAFLHDGQPLSAEHGAPARLIIPQLYAWKSAKWLGAIELTAKDQPGFWERNGYHRNGDPWREERFGW